MGELTRYIKDINNKEQWLLFIVVNMLFIYKYLSRTSINPFIGMASFLIILSIFLFAFYYSFRHKQQFINKQKRQWTEYFIIAITIVDISIIGLMLYYIDPLTVNVDRWSATSYFLDGLFSGTYPYGIHTHVCETNYPSPFPLWQYINLPFWLLGDVGLGLIFFLLLLISACYWFTKSSWQTLLFLILLTISPAYWWEVVVRSDGFSNAILVFVVIIVMEKYRLSFQNHWIFTTVLCSLMASTRLSAIIPLAIYLAKSFFKASILRQLSIISIIISIVFIFFIPYILWDTENWIFFSRNPLMSQTSTGSGWILCLMIIIALVTVLNYKTFSQYTRFTACFIFIFFLVSLTYNHLLYNTNTSFMNDADFDISYLTLSLPYCWLTITNSIKDNYISLSKDCHIPIKN